MMFQAQDKEHHSLDFGKHFSPSHVPEDGTELDEPPRDALTRLRNLPVLEMCPPLGFRMNI